MTHLAFAEIKSIRPVPGNIACYLLNKGFLNTSHKELGLISSFLLQLNTTNIFHFTLKYVTMQNAI